jgi:hypothetical protein
MEWMNISLYYEKQYIIKNKFVQVQTNDLRRGNQYSS